MEKTIRLTTAQALVKFLDQQYVSFDGKETKFVEGIFTIFGHGIAVGLGEALDQNPGKLKVFQGRNEQGMCHTACAFAKQHNRRKIIACTSSVGPGAANMVTACADATVNHIPLLVFPADTFASRQPDPVLQQLEVDSSLAVTTNDAQSNVILSNAEGVTGEKPLFFFLERYMQAYADEIKSFIDAVENDKETIVNIDDGLKPVLMAMAANLSVKEHRPVKLSEVEA